jgi:hypothetical protein
VNWLKQHKGVAFPSGEPSASPEERKMAIKLSRIAAAIRREDPLGQTAPSCMQDAAKIFDKHFAKRSVWVEPRLQFGILKSAEKRSIHMSQQLVAWLNCHDGSLPSEQSHNEQERRLAFWWQRVRKHISRSLVPGGPPVPPQHTEAIANVEVVLGKGSGLVDGRATVGSSLTEMTMLERAEAIISWSKRQGGHPPKLPSNGAGTSQEEQAVADKLQNLKSRYKMAQQSGSADAVKPFERAIKLMDDFFGSAWRDGSRPAKARQAEAIKKNVENASAVIAWSNGDKTKLPGQAQGASKEEKGHAGFLQRMRRMLEEVDGDETASPTITHAVQLLDGFYSRNVWFARRRAKNKPKQRKQ